jgi:hypothetical protein
VEKLEKSYGNMAVWQNLVPLVNIKIAGKWMFIPLKMVLIGIDCSMILSVPPETRKFHWIPSTDSPWSSWKVAEIWSPQISGLRKCHWYTTIYIYNILYI